MDGTLRPPRITFTEILAYVNHFFIYFILIFNNDQNLVDETSFFWQQEAGGLLLLPFSSLMSVFSFLRAYISTLAS